LHEWERAHTPSPILSFGSCPGRLILPAPAREVSPRRGASASWDILSGPRKSAAGDLASFGQLPFAGRAVILPAATHSLNDFGNPWPRLISRSFPLLVGNKLTGTTATAYHACYPTMLTQVGVKRRVCRGFLHDRSYPAFGRLAFAAGVSPHQPKSCRPVSSAQKVSPANQGAFLSWAIFCGS